MVKRQLEEKIVLEMQIEVKEKELQEVRGEEEGKEQEEGERKAE